MNKLLTVSLLGISILISGCTTKEQSNDNSFFKYDNKNHVIGDKNNYVKKVTYVQGDNRKIVFYIDKFPYKKEFNLCNKNDFIQNLKNNYKDSKYEENKNNNCKNYFYISKEEALKVPYWTSFNFNFLNGADYNKKHNLFLESTSNFSLQNSFFQDKNNVIDDSQKIYLSIED